MKLRREKAKAEIDQILKDYPPYTREELNAAAQSRNNVTCVSSLIKKWLRIMKAIMEDNKCN